MTAHRQISVLLIAVLLGCPFVCIAESGPAGCACPERNQRESCCDGESCCQEPSDEDAPSDDSSNLPKPDCACNGAVVQQSTVDCPESEADESIVVLLAPVDDALLRSRLAALSSPLAGHFPLLTTGREIRALTCAMLL